MQGFQPGMMGPGQVQGITRPDAAMMQMPPMGAQPQMMMPQFPMMQPQAMAPPQGMNPMMMMMAAMSQNPNMFMQFLQNMNPNMNPQANKQPNSTAKATSIKQDSTIKKGKNSFIFYKQEKMPEVSRQYPGQSCAQLMKVIGEMWKNVTPAEKERYQAMAQQDFQRYTNEVNLQKKGAKSQGTAAVVKKTNPAMKNKVSCYIVFSQERRPFVKQMYPQLSLTEQSKKIGEEWQHLSEEQKERYKKMANEINQNGGAAGMNQNGGGNLNGKRIVGPMEGSNGSMMMM